MLILGTVIGICISACCWLAISLSDFLVKVEESEKTCDICSEKMTCIAWKTCWMSEYTYVNQWMLVTYIALMKRCPYIKVPSVNKRLIIGFIGFMLFMCSFWSKGTDILGIVYGVVAIALFFLSIVDWNTQYIPLEMTGIIFLCGLIHLFADVSNWLEYVIGLIAVSGFLYIVNWIATPILRKKYQEDGQEIDTVIGDGDIKLMAATGLLLGWKLNFLALGIGCVLGSIIHVIFMKIKGSEGKFALGPYLSLGVYITMICGTQLVSWYLNAAGLMPQ